MIDNVQLRFKVADVGVPGGLAEAVESAATGRVLRWFVGQVTAREVVVEATIDHDRDGGFAGDVSGQRHGGRDVVVSVIPTGVGCTLGGYAGDAAPATRLLAAAADYLVTNPNAVNASDFIQCDDNVLYAEGFCIDQFCRGRVNFHLPRANRVGVVVEAADDAQLDLVFNVINAVRAVHGVDVADWVITDRPIGGRCRRNPSGAFVGTVDHPEVITRACERLLARGVDAIAITSNVQDLPLDEYARHFAGQAPSPVGGVEAIISHFVVDRFRVPAAHAPLRNVKDLALEQPVVDARGAGEYVSHSGLACVLVGLARAPQIEPSAGCRIREVVNVNNLVAVVAPAGCLGGIPALFAHSAGIPLIAVRGNQSILDVTREKLGLERAVEVASYAEAAGLLLALRRGVSLESLVRPLPTLRRTTRPAAARGAAQTVAAAGPHRAGAVPELAPEQVAGYRDDGFLFLPGLFSPAEVAVMKAQLWSELGERSERMVNEKDGKVVRSVYGSHCTNEVFARLARHPRIVRPAQQLLGDDVYVYQFKINAKKAFAGDLWEWHQDYVFWLEEDGLPQPLVTNVVVYLDEVTEFNGPMLLIPGSHREGVIAAKPLAQVPAEYADQPAWITDLTADLKFSVGRETVARLVAKHEMVAPKGAAGSVLFFHSNLVHGSSQNMSPFDRALSIVSYSSVHNVPTRVTRPEFLVSRDYDPIVPLADDALLAGLPAQEVTAG